MEVAAIGGMIASSRAHAMPKQTQQPKQPKQETPQTQPKQKPKKERLGETPALAWLRARGVAFTEHGYDYVDRGGTAESSRQLGVPEHEVIKTLVMEDDSRQPLLVLMHGDREVSTKNLARQAGVKSIQPCRPDVAQRHSGYLVGGTSPFATRKTMRVFVEHSVLALPRVFVNGGRRGQLVCLAPAVFVDELGAVPVECAS
jgi:Cys-tRNA(Pro) deacylase